MEVLVVSRSWPSSERSGVTLAAAAHVQMLQAMGCTVSIVGSHPSVLQEPLAAARYFVFASGSGALYAPARVDRVALLDLMRSIRPGLVVVEGLQTALTDAAIECAAQCGLRVLLVSHGVSVHPFDGQPADQLRALAWTPYRLWRLPRLIGCLAATTTLAEHAVSTRFHDRDLARAAGIPVLSLRNFAVHWQRGSPLLSERRRHVLVVGYFSRVKNQLAAIDTLPLLPPSVRMRFIGPRFGRYVKRCMQRVRLLGLVDRVDFLQDNECSIADEVASAAALLSTSLTEALPITLLEAMASGTPYVATEVGAVGELGGGTLAESAAQRATALRRILDDPTHWQALSAQGQERYATEFSRDRVASQLTAAVTAARLSP